MNQRPVARPDGASNLSPGLDPDVWALSILCSRCHFTYTSQPDSDSTHDWIDTFGAVKSVSPGSRVPASVSVGGASIGASLPLTTIEVVCRPAAVSTRNIHSTRQLASRATVFARVKIQSRAGPFKALKHHCTQDLEEFQDTAALPPQGATSQPLAGIHRALGPSCLRWLFGENQS